MKTKYFKKKVSNFIQALLRNREALRDSDNKLLANVWLRECKDLGLDLHEDSIYSFLKALGEGKFTTPESVTRCRRKLQEKHPELRGTSRDYRKNEMTTQVQEELGYNI